MKTTEIVIEQLAIGILFLLVLAVPFGVNVTGIDIGGGILLAAVAYALGVTLDRCADTLFERFEKRNRLRFCEKKVKARKQAEKAAATAGTATPAPAAG